MRGYILYTAFAGFLCGVAVDSLVSLSFYLSLLIFVLFLLVFIFFLFLFRKVIVIFLCAVFVFSASVGIVRHSYAIYNFSGDSLENFVGEKIEIEGLIVDEPDIRENNTRLTFLPKKFAYAKNFRKKILITVAHDALGEDFLYGDSVLVYGILELPENFETDTGREFDYVSYLAKDGIGYQMYRPDISLMARGQGNFIKSALLSVKKSFVENLESAIPAPHSSLAGGILLGAKHSLGKELTDAFRQSGLIHIVVLSGYNVTIVADFIIKIFSFLPKYAGVVGGMLGIVAFALITGSGATVVRASVMACIALVGRSTGRTYDIMRALFLAACVMVFHNPLILLSDPSFQLSCMATFALVVCSPFFEKYLCFFAGKARHSRDYCFHSGHSGFSIAHARIYDRYGVYSLSCYKYFSVTGSACRHGREFFGGNVGFCEQLFLCCSGISRISATAVYASNRRNIFSFAFCICKLATSICVASFSFLFYFFCRLCVEKGERSF